MTFLFVLCVFVLNVTVCIEFCRFFVFFIFLKVGDYGRRTATDPGPWKRQEREKRQERHTKGDI